MLLMTDFDSRNLGLDNEPFVTLTCKICDALPY